MAWTRPGVGGVDTCVGGVCSVDVQVVGKGCVVVVSIGADSMGVGCMGATVGPSAMVGL